MMLCQDVKVLTHICVATLHFHTFCFLPKNFELLLIDKFLQGWKKAITINLTNWNKSLSITWTVYGLYF